MGSFYWSSPRLSTGWLSGVGRTVNLEAMVVVSSLDYLICCSSNGCVGVLDEIDLRFSSKAGKPSKSWLIT